MLTETTYERTSIMYLTHMTIAPRFQCIRLARKLRIFGVSQCAVKTRDMMC